MKLLEKFGNKQKIKMVTGKEIIVRLMIILKSIINIKELVPLPTKL
jgi:hypothetical protein